MKPTEIAQILLQGLVAQEIMDNILADYPNFMDKSLALLGVDSLALFELLERIEEKFEVVVDYEALDFDKISTVNGVVKYVLDAKQKS